MKKLTEYAAYVLPIIFYLIALIRSNYDLVIFIVGLVFIVVNIALVVITHFAQRKTKNDDKDKKVNQN